MGEIFERQLVERSAEAFERLPDPARVLYCGPYPEIQIPGCAGYAVCGERVGPDDDEVSSGRGQRGQHLDVVAIQRPLLPGTPMPGG